MAPLLQIVAACTDRKGVSPAVQLRDFPDSELSARYEAWRYALVTSDAVRVEAEELYKGDYWSVVRSLPQVAAAKGWRASLWVASAGYGVVSASRKLVPYSATFARGHLDSIDRSDGGILSSNWWRRMTVGRHALGTSFASLAKDQPTATILVLASPAYLSAMAFDLEQAKATLARGASMVVISSAIPRSAPALRECWVESRAKHQEQVGGALVSLHARVARWLLSHFGPQDFAKDNPTTMSEKLGGAGPKAEARASRVAMSDDAVVAFIRARIHAEPKATHTRLLHELRESGRACEQARFRRLFASVKGPA